VKYSVITASQPQELTDTHGAELYVHQPALFKRMVDAGWIKPVVRERKTVLWRYKHLESCVDRLEAGDTP
jgi:hypothetical protein